MALPRRDFDDSGSTTVLPGALITVNVTTSSQLMPTLLGIVVLFLHYYCKFIHIYGWHDII